MKLVSVLLSKAYLKGLHELVRSGTYPSRSADFEQLLETCSKGNSKIGENDENCRDEISS